MDLTEEQERLLREVAEENERKAQASKRKDRTALLADIVRAQQKKGFRGDRKIRWRLDADADRAREIAADLLMRGLAYVIGPTVRWLPEYDDVADWLADNQGKGLMCIGDCGRGKTVITRDILPLLFEKTIRVSFGDGTVGHPIYNYFLAKEMKSRWTEIERSKVVCIDDVGTEAIAKVYGETHNYFSELVDLCNDRDKLLICSTNLRRIELFGGRDDDEDSPTYGQTFPQRYDQRIFSRLFGNTVRVYFEGEDLRLKQ